MHRKNQIQLQKKLFAEIAYMDSVLFTSFNSCDIEKFKTLFTVDLEFFHDKGGLSDYQKTVESMINTCKNKWKVRRELVEGSLEVYPVKDYGAIQAGLHRFL